MMEFEGTTFQKDYTGKIKQLNLSIIARDFEIDQLRKLVTKLEEDNEALTEKNNVVREKLKKLEIYHRNFKARVATA
jgi:regulator of replication initiation timing